ncbi:MAG: IS1595 family transposase [Alphaproteobacteria bacterium]|nr:IS1595 family transposase [Alphaproteobacteria bacterium]
MDLRNPIFNDENAAREHLEAILWPNGPHCPHCGEVEKFTKLHGKSHRPGLYVCNSCRGHFTVTVGTVLERSKIPLSKWVLGFHLMASSKKGVSAHQLHRMLGITYKSAWFMAHRIREAMRPVGTPERMGGGGSMVEVDETFIGRKKGKEVRHGYEHKMKVLSLVDRETGRAHSMVVEKLNTKTVRSIVLENVDREARLMTDEARHYTKVGREFADHQVVQHQAGEYGRGPFHTNTIEGFFSIFKRGMKGVYQHCSEEHLHRYLAEFDFRYSERAALGVEDAERAAKAVKGAAGKRLSYRRIDAG